MAQREPRNAVHQDMIHRDLVLKELRARQRHRAQHGLQYAPPAEEAQDARVAFIPPQRYAPRPAVLRGFSADNLEDGLFSPADNQKGARAQI